MAYRTRRYGRRRSSLSRTGRGMYRRRSATRRGRSVRLVIQAPRGILPRGYISNQWRRYRRTRRY